MQINGKTEKVIVQGRAIRNAIPGIIIGFAFIIAGVFFIFAHPVDDNGNEPGIILPALFIGLGGLALIASGFALLRAFRALTAKPATGEELKANMRQFDEGRSDITNLRNIVITSHMVGHVQGGLTFEDETGKTIYECRLTKFRIMGSDDYEFTDHTNNTSRALKMGKTITHETDGGLGKGSSLITSSGFKIDGVNCWDYLRSRGYEIRHMVLGKHMNSYELVKGGQVAAEIIASLKPGSYKIEINEARLEDVAMAAFIVFRADAVE